MWIWMLVSTVYLSIGWFTLFYVIYRKHDEPWDDRDPGEYVAASLVMLFWPLVLLFWGLAFLVKAPLRFAHHLSNKLHEKDKDDTISRTV